MGVASVAFTLAVAETTGVATDVCRYVTAVGVAAATCVAVATRASPGAGVDVGNSPDRFPTRLLKGKGVLVEGGNHSTGGNVGLAASSRLGDCF